MNRELCAHVAMSWIRTQIGNDDDLAKSTLLANTWWTLPAAERDEWRRNMRERVALNWQPGNRPGQPTNWREVVNEVGCILENLGRVAQFIAIEGEPPDEIPETYEEEAPDPRHKPASDGLVSLARAVIPSGEEVTLMGQVQCPVRVNRLVISSPMLASLVVTRAQIGAEVLLWGVGEFAAELFGMPGGPIREVTVPAGVQVSLWLRNVARDPCLVMAALVGGPR